MMSKGTVILFLWLIIGAAAAGQRGYFSTSNLDCTAGATMALTIVACPSTTSAWTPRSPAPCPSQAVHDPSRGTHPSRGEYIFFLTSRVFAPIRLSRAAGRQTAGPSAARVTGVSLFYQLVARNFPLVTS